MAKTLAVNVKNRVKLGDTKYDYIGTLTFGEYTSGGSPITAVTGAVSALPSAGFDHFTIGSGAGWTAEYVPGTTPVVKVYGSNKTDAEPGKEAADAKDLSAVKFTFRGVGS